MLLTTNCRLTETKSGTFVSQHVRPFLLFHGRLPPTSVASKIEEFGTLAACLFSDELETFQEYSDCFLDRLSSLLNNIRDLKTKIALKLPFTSSFSLQD